MSSHDKPNNRFGSICAPTAPGKAGPGKLRFFTIAQVAEILNLSPRSVRRLIDEHRLTVHRFGGAVRIAEADLRAFIAMRRAG
jgi:excisionase family DNA binding protein